MQKLKMSLNETKSNVVFMLFFLLWSIFANSLANWVEESLKPEIIGEGVLL